MLTALRGPDSRNRALKYATTCVIRKAAFPDEPTEGMSVFKTDRPEYAERRKEMFRDREDTNHFREHVSDAFTALDLFIDESNEI